jgi:selenocysteine-specific elongation factor
MIIATAGHVDHGKTSLIKALTGVDADRLPEEKKRGLTIDLGFVYDRKIADGTVIGFVDVPGHEKFIHNMLAGVTAIRAAMLVIAADDGLMPQTLEHLAILDLVGVADGFVALTKADLVPPDRLAAVTGDIQAILRDTPLAGAPIFPVSSTTGTGLPALAEHLRALAVTTEAPEPLGNFRLAIDRAFTVEGAGLVVTGLVHSGSVSTGDTVTLSPAGIDVRVRGLRAQDKPADRAVRGDRCAINLAGGPSKEEVHRGDWLVAPRAHVVTGRLDVRIRVLPGEAKPLKHWTPVHAHIGTADATGRIALLEERALEPGAAGLAQLVLDRTVAASGGDAVILRDQSALRTVGGGRVLDPRSPKRGRARPERITWLNALANTDRPAALSSILANHPAGLDFARLAAAWNLTEAEGTALRAEADAVWLAGADTPVGLQRAHWATLQKDIVTALDSFHRDRPDQSGIDRTALARLLPLRPLPAVLDGAVTDLIGKGELVSAGPLVLRPTHRAELTGKDANLWKRLEPLMTVADGKPPTIFELSEAAKIDKTETQRFLARAAKVGLVMRVSANRYMTQSVLADLAGIAETGAAALAEGRFSVAHYRDWSGLGRNLSIEILEFFDKIGLTRRIGNERAVVKPAASLFGPGGKGAETGDRTPA